MTTTAFSSTLKMCLPDAPFCIGPQSKEKNPTGIVDTYPMTLRFDTELARIVLENSTELSALLSASYELGFEMGTPSADSDLGRPYVDDFLAFMGKHRVAGGRLLEIGAGTGYLSRRLLDQGWFVDSIEPGSGYKDHWRRYGVEVINDFFPSTAVQGQYDVIVFYTVLEHISDTTTFLRTVRDHLAPGGTVILSVPDCTEEIIAGDPSMLLHEHFQYFTKPVLERTLAAAGLLAHVERSEFGRSLYAVATINLQSESTFIPSANIADVQMLCAYFDKVARMRETISEKLMRLAKLGNIGAYCPLRALYLLDPDKHVRFFDDAPFMTGKYLPPFKAIIEDRSAFLANPPDILVIFSRTFGNLLREQLQSELSKRGLACQIYTITDVDLLPIESANLG